MKNDPLWCQYYPWPLPPSIPPPLFPTTTKKKPANKVVLEEIKKKEKKSPVGKRRPQTSSRPTHAQRKEQVEARSSGTWHSARNAYAVLFASPLADSARPFPKGRFWRERGLPGDISGRLGASTCPALFSRRVSFYFLFTFRASCLQRVPQEEAPSEGREQ